MFIELDDYNGDSVAVDPECIIGMYDGTYTASEPASIIYGCYILLTGGAAWFVRHPVKYVLEEIRTNVS